MRAWVINRYGPNDVLALTENHPVPSVNFAHEVVVQVHAASMNPLDINMRGEQTPDAAWDCGLTHKVAYCPTCRFNADFTSLLPFLSEKSQGQEG